MRRTASPQLSALVALCNKSFDLGHAGHMARALEYQKRALAAAQAMGAEDCLIVAALQMNQANLVHEAVVDYCQEHVADTGDANVLAMFARISVHLCAAAHTVERRIAAGTLMPGTCRAAEETWYQLVAAHKSHYINKLDEQQCVTGRPQAAPYCGYVTLLKAADFVLHMLRCVDVGAMHMAQEQLHTCMMLVTAAVEDFLKPRVDIYLSLSAEAGFAETMRRQVADPDLVLKYAGEAGAQLLESWKRVEQSGELQRRRVDFFQEVDRHAQEMRLARTAAAAAAPGLRSCHLPGCCAREAHPAHFKSCAACRGVVYCCREHQTEHWPSHRAACKAARKAAAANKNDDAR